MRLLVSLTVVQSVGSMNHSMRAARICTAQTASTIELRALAGGRADDGIVAMAAGLRSDCTACLVLVDGLMQEGVRCE